VGVVADLTRDIFYLADAGDAGVVVLQGPDARIAPLFSSRSRAAAFAGEAPAGVRVARAPAGDPRAREELLLACLGNGAEVLALDPAPGGERPARPASVRLALAAVRSHRVALACL